MAITTGTTAPTAPSRAAPFAEQAIIAGIVLAAFTAYSLWVIAGYGYTGFLTLAGREPWAMQLLLDLVIAVSFALGWLRGDARRHGITAWPFYLGAIFLGSISLLTYVVVRGVVTRRRRA